MDKKKLALVVKGRLNLSYLSPDILVSLTKCYELYVICPKPLYSEVSERINSFGITSRYYEESRDSYQLAHFEELFSILRYRFMHRSKSFKYRHRRYGTYKTIFQNFLWFAYEKLFHDDAIRVPSFAPKTMRENFNRLVVDSRNLVKKKISFAYFLLSNNSQTRFQNKVSEIQAEPSIVKVIDEVRPDLLLFPSHNYDPIDFDLLNSCKIFGVTSLSITENWDNLSSKSTPLVYADHITCWGAQTFKHATEIQGYKDEKVHILGSPRIHRHFETIVELEKSQRSSNKILFLGASHFTREQSILLKISQLIKDNPLFRNFKLVYRPHPQHTQQLDIERLTKSGIEMNTNYSQTLENDQSLTKLIFDSTFIIGPYTTAVLESLLCGKTVIGLAYREPFSVYSPRRQRDYFVHLKELSLINHLIEVRRMKDMRKALVSAYDLSRYDSSTLRSQSAKGLQYFYKTPHTSFGEDLHTLVKAILPT